MRVGSLPGQVLVSNEDLSLLGSSVVTVVLAVVLAVGDALDMPSVVRWGRSPPPRGVSVPPAVLPAVADAAGLCSLCKAGGEVRTVRNRDRSPERVCVCGWFRAKFRLTECQAAELRAYVLRDDK